MIIKDNHFLEVTVFENDAGEDMSTLSSNRFYRWHTRLSQGTEGRQFIFTSKKYSLGLILERVYLTITL